MSRTVSPAVLVFDVKSKCSEVDWRTHHAMMAYFSDSFLIGASLLPHAESMDYSKGFMTSLDHSIWIHDHMFRVDEWLLFDVHAPILCTSLYLLTLYIITPYLYSHTRAQGNRTKYDADSLALEKHNFAIIKKT